MSLDEMTARIITSKAEKIFFSPEQLYNYEDIVNGIIIKKGNGSFGKEKAIFNNTIRAFHRVDKNRPSIAQEIDNYFIVNKNKVIAGLSKIDNEESLHKFENDICNSIRNLPNLNIENNKLYYYNLIRKPIDLFIEHFVLLSKELNDKRNNLIQFLFVPLDKWILSEKREYCFFETDLSYYGIKKGSGFTSIKDERTYIKLQNILNNNANYLTNKFGIKFYRIYFDLFWNNRYRNSGGNIWQLNYK